MASNQTKPKSSYYGKKNFNYYKNNRYQLRPDLKGFLCTCNFGLKDCQKEALNLLREYSENSGKQSEEAIAVEETADIMDSLDSELQSLSKKDNADWNKFSPIKTDTTNCVFISTTIEDPCELVCKILEDIEKTKVQKTKFLLRMLPISITCKANIPSITLACKDLFAKHFSSEPTTFAILYTHRCNHSLERMKVIEELATMVCSLGNHTVDLSGAAKMSIIVEVVKSICCLSVVRDYTRFGKYNLLTVSGHSEKRTSDDEKVNVESSPSKIKKQIEDNDEVSEHIGDEEKVNIESSPSNIKTQEEDKDEVSEHFEDDKNNIESLEVPKENPEN